MTEKDLPKEFKDEIRAIIGLNQISLELYGTFVDICKNAYNAGYETRSEEVEQEFQEVVEAIDHLTDYVKGAAERIYQR